jgi:hypothetical protein
MHIWSLSALFNIPPFNIICKISITSPIGAMGAVYFIANAFQNTTGCPLPKMSLKYYTPSSRPKR